MTARVLTLITAVATLLFTAPAAHAQAGPCSQELKAPQDDPARPGTYKPKCTQNGYYELVQVNASTGYSWCVNPKTGAKINGTEKVGTPQAVCG